MVRGRSSAWSSAVAGPNSGVPRKGAHVSVTGTVREGFSLGSVGEKMKLPPAVSAGILLMESSHKAK